MSKRKPKVGDKVKIIDGKHETIYKNTGTVMSIIADVGVEVKLEVNTRFHINDNAILLPFAFDEVKVVK